MSRASSRDDPSPLAALDRGEALLKRDPAGALALADSALAVGLPAALRARAQLLRGHALSIVSRQQEALVACERARELYTAQGDVRGEVNALRARGNVRYRQARYPEALADFLQSQERAHAAGLTAERVRVLNNIGALHSSAGNIAEALESYLQGLQGLGALPTAEATELRTMLLTNLGEAHRRLGQYSEGLEYAHEALAEARAADNPHYQAITLMNIGVLHGRMGEPDAARARLEEALALHRQVGDRRHEVSTLQHLAGTLLEQGHTEAALARFADALALGRAGEDHRVLAELQLRRGDALLRLGDRAAACEALIEALRLAERGDFPVERRDAHLQLAAVHEAVGEYRAAYAHLKEAHDRERQLLGEEQRRRIQALRVQHELEQAHRAAATQRNLNEELRRSKAQLEDAYHQNQALLQQVQHQARHDPLTGLPNRILFGERLHWVVEAARHEGSGFALMFLDLDGFKAVNDRLGHDAGDELLVAVAARLRGALRGGDTLARMGGDEFMVIAPGLGSREDASPLAERLLKALSVPLSLRGEMVTVGASLGVAVYPQDAGDAGELQRCADSAMYSVKRAGGGLGWYHGSPAGTGPGR